jgi:hypothetical protein
MPGNGIEKHVILKASLERVRVALTDSRQFGAGFGMVLDGPFVAGKPLSAMVEDDR